jgi:hypothetical protein
VQQAGVFDPEHVVRLAHARQFVFEAGRMYAFGAQIGIGALQTPVALGQAILQDALEARFGVTLVAAAPVFALDQ